MKCWVDGAAIVLCILADALIWVAAMTLVFSSW